MKHVLTRILLAAVLALWNASPVWAGYDEGMAAYQLGDYATAIKEFLPIADQGSAEAQYMLGAIYQDGLGVTIDYAEAARWYDKAARNGNDELAEISLKQVFRILREKGMGEIRRKNFKSALRLFQPAADLGDAESQHWVGIIYYDGIGVPQDYREAMKWYFRAADQGHAGAQYYLGVMSAKGKGTFQDYREAKKWLAMAAEQGDASAQEYLGIMYHQGQGVPQDYLLAHMWFNLAAANYSIVFSSEPRDRAASNRDSVATVMTNTQIAEAQRLAREWLEEHGE